MIKKNLLLLLIFIPIFSALIVTSSCKKKTPDTHVIIEDGNGTNILGDTIHVSLNSVHQTIFDITYANTNNSPKYTRQINEGNILELNTNHEDYKIISHGTSHSARENVIFFEESKITTTFSDTSMSVGSIVKITARVSTEDFGSVYYLIK